MVVGDDDRRELGYGRVCGAGVDFLGYFFQIRNNVTVLGRYIRLRGQANQLISSLTAEAKSKVIGLEA